MTFIMEFLSYDFIIKALLSGVLISLCAAMLGVVLVLKKYSMIGDGLSHVGFGAVSLAMLFNTAPLVVAIPVVMLASFFLLKVGGKGKISGDTAIGMISVSSLAAGVIITSLNSGMNTDINSLMFGSILALSEGDVIFTVVSSIFVILLYSILYNKIFSVTFDEEYSAATGINTELNNMIIALMTSLIIVLGMRIMGTMLISGLVIFPAVTSMKLFKSFKSVVAGASVISVICFVSGLIISFAFSVPAGASVIGINLVAFLLASISCKFCYSH